MRLKVSRKTLSNTILVVSLSALPVAAQNIRVDVSKRAATIPKACVSVVPASIEGPVDVFAIVKEAICKGAGDMLIEYTYVLNSLSRVRDNKGMMKEETSTYEVFIPTLKSGMHTRGILLLTNRNGVAVPADDLGKERLKTGERLEKEEDKIARAEAPASPTNSDSVKGMLPLGMYTRTSINRAAFGIRRGGVSLSIDDFLGTCDLTLLRREHHDGREALIFRFLPRPDAQFGVNKKYIAQLTGEIWIDATDRIVTRLAGWPQSPKETNANEGSPALAERPPAVYVEMMRLREGAWLPRLIRINGLDYPTLFDHMTFDSIWTYRDFIHFSTEIRDVKVNSSEKP